MVFVHILRLEHGKYYVKRSNAYSVGAKSYSCENEDGFEWMKTHRLLYVERTILDCDEYDEDKFVIVYMDKYGIDNVRGGSFSSPELSREEYSVLMKMSRGNPVPAPSKTKEPRIFIGELNARVEILLKVMLLENIIDQKKADYIRHSDYGVRWKFLEKYEMDSYQDE
jgi:hypothetical protein